MTVAELLVGLAWWMLFGGAVVTVRCVVHVVCKRSRRVTRLSSVAFGLVVGAVLIDIVGFIQTTRGSDDNTAFDEALPGVLLLSVLIGGIARAARIIAAKRAPGEDEHSVAPPITLNNRSARYLIWLGAFLCTFPLSFVITSYFELSRWTEVQTWSEHPALIERLNLHQYLSSHRDRDTLVYSLKGSYRYEVDRSTFEGTRLSLYPVWDSGAWNRKLFRRLDQARRTGQKLPCYVDPSNPSESVLVRDLRIGTLITNALGGLVMLTAGVWLIRFARSAPRQPSS